MNSNSYVFLGEVHKNFTRAIVEAHLILPFVHMGMKVLVMKWEVMDKRSEGYLRGVERCK